MPHASIRKITKAIEAAGGRVERPTGRSAGQHLLVYGPDGRGPARIGIELNTGKMARNIEATLRKYAGLEVKISG